MFCDRRTSVRKRSIDGSRAILLIGPKECPVRIINESAGGYCVLMSDPIAPVVDAEAVLRFGEIAQVVRITHVRLAGVHTRVGLQRLDPYGATAVAKRRQWLIRVATIAFAGLFVVLVIDHVLHRYGF